MQFITPWRPGFCVTILGWLVVAASGVSAQTSSTAPYFDPIPDRDTVQDNTTQRHPPSVSFVVNATNATHISATGLPGISGPITGASEIIYTYYEESMPPGVFHPTVTATSASGETFSRQFTWTVHPSPWTRIQNDKSTYQIGDTITLTLGYSVPVVVTGTPYVELWPGKHVPYVSGSGTKTLTFQATVDATDTTHRGLMPDRLALGDGSIATSDGASANLRPIPSPDGMGGMQYPFDVIAASPPGGPVITGFSPPFPGLYGTSRGGMTLSISFNAKVVLTGHPSITVRAGNDAFEFTDGRVVGDGSDMVFFLDWAKPLTANGPLSITGPINLNGGALTGIDGTDAVLTFTPFDVPAVVFDTTVPVAPTVASIVPQSPTPDQSFTVSGTGEAKAGLSVRLDGNYLPGATVDGAGNWSVTVPKQAAGNHTLVFAEVDAARNVSPATTVTVTVATPPPDNPPPPTTTPPPVTTKADQTITFNSPTGAVIVGQAIQLGATSSAGLPITYTVVSGDATISGNTLTPTSTAALIVRASSAGNDTVNAASVDVNFGNPQKSGQTIHLATATGAAPAEKPITLSATADSGLPVIYTIVSGPATISGNILTFTGTGNVTVRASQPGDGTHAAAEDVTFTFTANPVNRLVNLSSRVHVTAGDATKGAIAGFAVTGDQPKQILVRAVGPTLAAFGVTGIPAPQLTLFDGQSKVIAANTGWNNDAQIAAAGSAVGAFGLAVDSKDAALLVTLTPGLYTAQVQSSSDGVVLIEVYDVSANAAVPTKQLINISTRGTVGTDDNVLVAGFVVAGNEPKRVLIRGVGPGLSTFGVAGVLSDPALKLYDAHNTVLARNDNWETTAHGDVLSLSTTAADVTAADTAAGAFALAPGSKDAALVVTLSPGQYTATVSGVNNTTGAAIVEVYELP